MLQILIADDHDIVRRGLHYQLSQHQDWKVCGEARDGREAVELALQLKPDVVVMDLSMPELNGLEATRKIRHALDRTEILVFTMHESEDMIHEVLSSGARGYVLKSDAECHVISAIEALSHHKTYFTSSVSVSLLERYLTPERTDVEKSPPGLLTHREREVVQMLAEGKSNKEIADDLTISVKTVETHRATVMRKLDINSIVELVHYAIRNQIVQA